MRKYKSKVNCLGLVKSICDDCGVCKGEKREFNVVVRKSEDGKVDLYGIECSKRDVRVF